MVRSIRCHSGSNSHVPKQHLSIICDEVKSGSILECLKKNAKIAEQFLSPLSSINEVPRVKLDLMLHTALVEKQITPSNMQQIVLSYMVQVSKNGSWPDQFSNAQDELLLQSWRTCLAWWLLSQEMEPATQVQILSMIVCILLCANALGKCLNTYVLSRAMDK